MIGIDLFAGAGGLSLGAELAGIDVKLAIEKDPYSAETYSYNHKNTILFEGDIQSFRKDDLPLKKSPVVVFGGPPCQGFSTSNQKTRNITNPSNWLFREFIRMIKIYNPEWVVLENVKGIADTSKGEFLDIISNEIKECGYSISQWLLNAADFGVPQIRNRFFIIGSRKGHILKRPNPICNERVNVHDAISDLPKLVNGAHFPKLKYRTEPSSTYAKSLRKDSVSSHNNYVTKNSSQVLARYKHIPQGGNWENIPDNLMTNYKDKTRCHTGIYRRLKSDDPSVVIGNYRKNMLIHPSQDRGLSVREAARLQSFPDSYIFKGPFGFQQQQVGNAVPPLLAKVVFKVIKKIELETN